MRIAVVNTKGGVVDIAVEDEAEAVKHKPTCLYVDRDNRMTHTNHSMPKQAA